MSTFHRGICIINNLASFSPESAPYFWFFVNGFTVLYSALLVLIVLFAAPESKTDHFAREWFLIYDMLTSLIWPIEISLTEIHMLSVRFPDPKYQRWRRVQRVLEWMIAIYFAIDAFRTLMKKIKGKNHTDQMRIEAIVNLLAYSFKLWSNDKSQCAVQNDYTVVEDVLV
jgi:hypothetical protein